MMLKLFILVPAFDPTGPVKGAVALANALADDRDITLVSLKGGPGLGTPLDPRVKQISLSGSKGWHKCISAYRTLLTNAGGRSCTASISFCFSADMINLFCRPYAVTCTSVRGNLLCNYRMDYGLSGIVLAVAHLTALRGFDHIVAMTGAMAEQIRLYSGRNPEIIGNFIDEKTVTRHHPTTHKEGPFHFVFLASLSARKRPLQLIHAMASLSKQGFEVKLDIIGEGVLRHAVETEICRLGLKDSIFLHGYLADPYDLVSQADVMVLPSVSEGLPRAALEAMHLGVPCVLRDADGNSELVHQGKNGSLFGHDEDLPAVMMETALWSRSRSEYRDSLLPHEFRQRKAALQYLALIESSR